MRVSFDGAPVHEIARRITAEQLGLVCAEFPEGTAYAILSMSADTVCIEAIEGTHGTILARMIVDHARIHGLPCEAWVFNHARARLAARAGMVLTGAERTSFSGRQQLQVHT